MNIKHIKKLTITAVFAALGIILPIIFHSVEIFGRIFLPMHLTVIMCSMITGAFYGSICAIITILVSTMVTGMPVLYPMAVIMIFELITYSITSAFILKLTITKINKVIAIYLSLIIAMIIGRIVLGIASVIFIGLLGDGYSLNAFISGAFITALPGIIIQFILIPFILLILDKAKLINLNEI